MADDEYTGQLVERNKRLNELLQNTSAQLEEERRLNMLAKNRVTGGYYMMSRAAEKNLRALQKENGVLCRNRRNFLRSELVYF